jgi:hypothetical protein
VPPARPRPVRLGASALEYFILHVSEYEGFAEQEDSD